MTMKSVGQNIQKLDLQSPEFKQAPEALWRALRDASAVVTTRQPLLGRISLTTRYEESRKVLNNTELFSVDARRCGHTSAAGMRWWVPKLFKPLASNLLTLDGPEHRALRQRVDYAFKRTELNSLQVHIEQEASRAIGKLRENIQRNGSADFIADVARPVPQYVISKLLGLDDMPDDDSQRLARDLSALGSMQKASDIFTVIPAIKRISGVLNSQISERRSRPRNDLLTRLIVEEGEGQALDKDQLLAMTFLLYVAGHETTTHLMSTSLWAILTNESIAEQVSTSLDDKSIHEFVRYLSPVQMSKPRFVLQDVKFAGTELKKGDTVAALIGAANHDERVFENPEIFNLEKASARHLGFGAGAHACFGLHLALRETSTVINKLLQDPTLHLAPARRAFEWNRRLGLRSLKYLHVSNRKVTHF